MTADKYPVIRLTAKSKEILNGKVKFYHKKDLLQRPELLRRWWIIPCPNRRKLDKNLFESLRQLRHTIAQSKGLPPYIIFHDASLKEMATYMPQNREEFFKIKGVGQKKYETYGEEFINLINEYIEEGGLNINVIRQQIKKGKTNIKTDRYEQTYEHYLRGLTLEEIAKSRNLTTNTIINHLARCEERGKTIDWSRFIDTEKENKILQVIEKVGAEKLRPIKEVLPEEITYEDIRLVVCKHA